MRNRIVLATAVNEPHKFRIYCYTSRTADLRCYICIPIRIVEIIWDLHLIIGIRLDCGLIRKLISGVKLIAEIWRFINPYGSTILFIVLLKASICSERRFGAPCCPHYKDDVEIFFLACHENGGQLTLLKLRYLTSRHGVTSRKGLIFRCTVIPRLTSDPANEFFV